MMSPTQPIGAAAERPVRSIRDHRSALDEESADRSDRQTDFVGAARRELFEVVSYRVIQQLWPLNAWVRVILLPRPGAEYAAGMNPLDAATNVLGS